MQIDIDAAGLSSTGTQLAAALTGPTPATVPVTATDPVTLWANGFLAAASARLSAALEHGDAIRAAGGASLTGAAAHVVATDEHSASLFRGAPSGELAAASPLPEAPGVPDLPGVPAMPAAPVITGEMWAQLVHNGIHGDGWRATAAALRTHSGKVSATADTSRAAIAVDEHWQDGGLQQAGANTAEHAGWLSGTGTEVDQLAGMYEDCAAHHDRMCAATPRPDDFAAATLQAQTSSAAGDLIGYITAVRRYSELSGQATEAMASYHTDVVATTSAVSMGHGSAPPIHRGDGVALFDQPLAPPQPLPEPAPPYPGEPRPGDDWSDDPVMEIAQRIAYGHAWDKHGHEFGLTQDELAQRIYEAITAPPSEVLQGTAPNGADVPLHDGVIVIVDPPKDDYGTVYKPPDPMHEFHRLNRAMPEVPLPEGPPPRPTSPGPRLGGFGLGPMGAEGMPRLIELDEPRGELDIIGDNHPN